VEKPKPRPSGVVEEFKAPELVSNFMDAGGMRDAIYGKLTKAMRDPEGGNAEFRTSIRLLACETGAIHDENARQGLFSTRSADSYARDVANQFGKQVGDILGQLKKNDPQGYEKATFSVEIVVAAPTGWNLNMPNGQTVVYHSTRADEKEADAAAKIAYEQSRTKADMQSNKTIAPYLVADEEKKTVVTVRFDKYPGQRLICDVG
jgi:hypothetical protein